MFTPYFPVLSYSRSASRSAPAVAKQEFIGFAEMTTSKKASVRRQRTWMRSLQDQMLRIIEHGFFGLCRTSPQKKNNRPILFIQDSDRCIGKLFPADAPVRVCLMCTDSQHCIQHQHSLFRPLFQITVIRNIASQIVMQFLININQ